MTSVISGFLWFPFFCSYLNHWWKKAAGPFIITVQDSMNVQTVILCTSVDKMWEAQPCFFFL